jgi:hypothetical protein
MEISELITYVWTRNVNYHSGAQGAGFWNSIVPTCDGGFELQWGSRSRSAGPPYLAGPRCRRHFDFRATIDGDPISSEQTRGSCKTAAIIKCRKQDERDAVTTWRSRLDTRVHIVYERKR